jgi:hypothetical protein
MSISFRFISLLAMCGLLVACSHLGPTRLAGDPEPSAAEETAPEKGFFAKLLSPRKADDGPPKDTAEAADASEPAPAEPAKKGFFAKLLSPRKAEDAPQKDTVEPADASESASAEPAKKGFFAKLFPWSQKTAEPEESEPEPEPVTAEPESPLPAPVVSLAPAPREPETTLAPTRPPAPASGKPGDPLDDIGLYPKDQ